MGLGPKAILGIGAVAALVVTGLFASRTSPEDKLQRLLSELSPETSVELDGCMLEIRAETRPDDGGPIALSRFLIRTDLHTYDLSQGRILPGDPFTTLRIEPRRPATDEMMAQAEAVFAAGLAAVPDFLIAPQDLRATLDAGNGTITTRVMAEVKTDSAGQTELIASEDAPAFFRFAEAVEALPAPTSFRSTTTYAPGGPSAETLLTGEVVILPPLIFRMQNQLSAQALGQAFYDYAGQSCS